jgi:hypothetical protein
MSKKEILEKMQQNWNVSKEEAEKLFCEAVENGELRRRLSWKTITDYSIIAMIIISGIYALFRII